MKILKISHLTQGLDLMRKVAHFQGTDYAKNMPDFLRDCPNIKNIQMEEAKDLIRIFRARVPNYYLISSKKDSKPKRTKSLRPKAKILFASDIYSNGYYDYAKSGYIDDDPIDQTIRLRVATEIQLSNSEVCNHEDIELYIQTQMLLLTAETLSTQPELQPELKLESIQLVSKKPTKEYLAERKQEKERKRKAIRRSLLTHFRLRELYRRVSKIEKVKKFKESSPEERDKLVKDTVRVVERMVERLGWFEDSG